MIYRVQIKTDNYTDVILVEAPNLNLAIQTIRAEYPNQNIGAINEDIAIQYIKYEPKIEA